MDIEALKEQVAQLPWFHELDLGNGVITPGRGKLPDLQAVADIYFPESLAGKTVLDIGCYDGFNSFDATKKGADRVLATDNFMWSIDPRCKAAFLLARSCIAPRLEYRQIDHMAMSPALNGTFDIVLYAGVLYHEKNPFLAVEHIAKLAQEKLIVETYLDAMDRAEPAAIFYPGTELNGDPTNWWGPNPPCVIGMLKNCGFAEVVYTPHPSMPHRGVFHAHR